MIGQIFHTFVEKFRKEIPRYCWECGKEIGSGRGLTLWCGRRCKARTTARGSVGVGKIYHRPGGSQ